MPRTIVLDFETFYDKEYSLRKMSYPEYILDTRFTVQVLGVDYGKGKQEFIAPEDIADFLPTLGDAIVVGNNLFFDAGIMAWKYNFRPAYMIDTLFLANHVLGSARDGGERNDLGTLATRLGLSVNKGDLGFMLGVRVPSPAQLGMLKEYLGNDLTITREILKVLYPQISNVEFELWLADHTLRIYTDKLLPVDRTLVVKTRELITERRIERVTAAGVPNEILSSNQKFAAELTRRMADAKMVMPLKRSPTTGKMIPALAKGDAAFLALTESPNEAVRNLVRGRLVERSAAQALARLATLEKFADVGIPVHLVYYGAHTGRFAASGGFNFQNLTSPARAVDAVDREIATSIRASIVAGDGQVFVASDAAQIEARVLAWLAGEESILEAFAAGADIYSQFISTVLGEEIHKPRGDESESVKHHLGLMRQIGKEAVLGLGYGMGVDKFMFTLRAKDRNIAKLIDAGKITTKFGAKVVATYREMYPSIVGYWAELNDAFIAAHRGAVREVGPLTFRRLADKGVGITLPSTRQLYYRHLRMEKRTGETTYTDAGGKTKTIEHKGMELKHGNGQRIYGGLLAENITQAIARDILVEGILKVEQAGIPVVLHVHDEIVVRVPEVQGPSALEFLNQALSEAPPWGTGMVLAAEGRISKNLSK